MLNPWLAITFQAMRLGFEAQNAVTLRVMRLVGAANKTEARSIADKASAPPDAQEAAIKVASDSDRRRKAVTKGPEKRVRANKRRPSISRFPEQRSVSAR